MTLLINRLILKGKKTLPKEHFSFLTEVNFNRYYFSKCHDVMFNINEENLFSAVRNGNESAFELFFKKYQPGLFVFCYNLTGDEESAKDITQDTFVSFWENRKIIRTDYSITSYLFKIAHSKCYRYLKRNSVKSNFSDLSKLELAEIELAYYSEEKNITDSIYFNEINDVYEKIVKKLPKQCQEVFIMSQKDEMKSGEIADKLSLSLRTVENHLYRATKFVRNEMKQFATLMLSLILFIGK